MRITVGSSITGPYKRSLAVDTANLGDRDEMGPLLVPVRRVQHVAILGTHVTAAPGGRLQRA